MLLFPPSSIQEPLRDSTNWKRLTHSTENWKHRSGEPSHLTDPKASETDSIYNASTAPSESSSNLDLNHYSVHSSFASDHELHPHQPRAKSEAGAEHDMVRFVNRPNGTPLFTIAEQKSLATLRSQISRTTFRRKGPTHSTVTISGKPRAASADDTVLLGFWNKQSRHVEASSSVDYQSTREDPVHPLQPPFGPPHRVETPEGVPHWSPDTRVSFMHQIARSLRLATSSPANGTRSFVRTLRYEYQARRRGRARRWRPPVSGQATPGYDQPSRHPLNNAPLAEVARPEAHEDDDTLPIPEPTTAERQSLDNRCRSRSTSTSSAQRALGAISGNAVPINPARKIRARSVSVPQNHIVQRAETEPQPPLRRNMLRESQTVEPYSSDTMRTIDMIENFPSPPTRRPKKARGKLQVVVPESQRVSSIQEIKREVQHSASQD